MKAIKYFAILAVLALLVQACTLSSHSMKTPNNYIELTKADFDFSEQVSGEATEVKVFGIDWARIFTKKMGEIDGAVSIDIPIIGGFLGQRVNTYAVYNMIKDNPGYDVVMYPQFETKVSKTIIVKVTRVKVTARLGKLKR